MNQESQEATGKVERSPRRLPTRCHGPEPSACRGEPIHLPVFLIDLYA